MIAGAKKSIWVVLTLAILVSYASGQTNPRWKVFSNRAGWSIGYPAEWKISSCRNCKDPTAPDVFVDFFPPRRPATDGSVLVEHLASKPSGTDADAWLADISTKANLNPQYNAERLTLDGFPALKVRYRNSAAGVDMESVYVLYGLETFEIEFGSPDASGVLPDKLPNYDIYLKMLTTFRMKIQPESLLNR
jgi:hypothetical protein